MKIKVQGISDVGILREHNEDSFVINEELNFYMVADGMGGHVAGGRASKLAVEVVEDEVRKWFEAHHKTKAEQSEEPTQETSEQPQKETLEPEEEKLRPKKTLLMGALEPEAGKIPPKEEDPIITMLTKAVQRASAEILEESQTHPQYAGMGTTTTCLLILDDRGYYAHVGDSRLYRIRGKEIEQITEDHSLVHENVKMGFINEDEARRSPYKNIITRSVGFDPNVAVDTGVIDIVSGDRFVLCSDGLTNLVTDEEIYQIVTGQELETALKFLVNLANSRGGDDNITVIIVAID